MAGLGASTGRERVSGLLLGTAAAIICAMVGFLGALRAGEAARNTRSADPVALALAENAALHVELARLRRTGAQPPEQPTQGAWEGWERGIS